MGADRHQHCNKGTQLEEMTAYKNTTKFNTWGTLQAQFSECVHAVVQQHVALATQELNTWKAWLNPRGTWKQCKPRSSSHVKDQMYTPKSAKICHSERDGESEMLYFDGTRSIHNAMFILTAKVQISWIKSLWSNALADPLRRLPSAPTTNTWWDCRLNVRNNPTDMLDLCCQYIKQLFYLSASPQRSPRLIRSQ